MNQEISCDENENNAELFYRTRSLWRAVILQSIIDATGDYKRTENVLEKHKATVWIEEMKDDFRLVCMLAGYDHHYVKNKAKSAIQAHKIRKLKKEMQKNDKANQQTYG